MLLLVGCVERFRVLGCLRRFRVLGGAFRVFLVFRGVLWCFLGVWGVFRVRVEDVVLDERQLEKSLHRTMLRLWHDAWQLRTWMTRKL